MKVEIKPESPEVIEVEPQVIERMKQQLTDETYANRVKSDWQHITRQLVSVDRINGIYYGYSTEIGVLRLLHHYHVHGSSKNTRVFFSENLGTWVFVLDMT